MSESAKPAPNPRITGPYEVRLGPKDSILFEVDSFCVIRRQRSRHKWPQRPDMPETIYWLASRLEDDLVMLLEGIAPRTLWQATRDEMIEKCQSMAKLAGST